MQRLIIAGALALGALLLIWMASQPLVVWATEQQRALQGDLAAALRAVRGGDLTAVAAMIGLCGLYGVVHAVGPGHGKILIGGAAVASQSTARRMAGMGFAASLAQGVTALLLVYGGLGLFTVTSRTLIGLSETWLTAASYAAICAVGLWMLWRGARLALILSRVSAHPEHPRHAGACGPGCRHAPTVEEARQVGSWRDAAALIVSIGMRPCSGAMLVLALSWRFETYLVGAASVLAMAIGTGLVVAIVALAAVRLRETGRVSDATPLGQWSFAAAQLGVGAAIVMVSASLAAAAIGQTGRPHPFAQSAPAATDAVAAREAQPAQTL